jgi:hypothetical protein
MLLVIYLRLSQGKRSGLNVFEKLSSNQSKSIEMKVNLADQENRSELKLGDVKMHSTKKETMKNMKKMKTLRHGKLNPDLLDETINNVGSYINITHFCYIVIFIFILLIQLLHLKMMITIG